MSCNTSYGFLTAGEARKCARDNTLIFQEISLLQAAILAAIDAKNFEVVISNNTPMTGDGGILSVAITDGGDDYEPIVASAAIVHPLGVNATVSLVLTGGTITGVTVSNGGTGYDPIPATVTAISRVPNLNATLTPILTLDEVTSFTIVDAGQGYHVGDDIVITDGSGVNATAEVSTVGALGEITGYTITNNGSGYVAPAATVTRIVATAASLTLNVNATTGAISSVTIGSGGTAYHVGDVVSIAHPSGVSAILQVGTIGPNGNITNVAIVAGGSGYQTVVAEVEVTHPAGVAFTSTVAVNNSGVITGVTVTNGGIGYGPLIPTITVADTTGSGATFSLTVNNAGEIDTVTVTNKGSNYTAPVLTVVPALTSPGDGAILTPTLEQYDDAQLYHSVFAGLTTDREIDDQIQFVLDYFTSLGYNIKAKTNPVTEDTLQWHIIW